MGSICEFPRIASSHPVVIYARQYIAIKMEFGMKTRRQSKEGLSLINYYESTNPTSHGSDKQIMKHVCLNYQKVDDFLSVESTDMHSSSKSDTYILQYRSRKVSITIPLLGPHRIGSFWSHHIPFLHTSKTPPD